MTLRVRPPSETEAGPRGLIGPTGPIGPTGLIGATGTGWNAAAWAQASMGIIATGSLYFSDGAVLAAGTNTWSNTLTATLASGRRYRIRTTCRAAIGASSSNVYIYLMDGAANLGDRYNLVTSGAYNQVHGEWLVIGDGASHTFQLFAVMGVSTTCYVGVSSFYIEDIGTTSVPTIPLPDTPPAWNNVTFQNGWVDYAAGWILTGYRKIGDLVEIRGMIKNGTIGTTVFYLPPGYRPTATGGGSLMFVGNSVEAHASLHIAGTDGSVYVRAGNNSWIGFGFTFSVS